MERSERALRGNASLDVISLISPLNVAQFVSVGLPRVYHGDRTLLNLCALCCCSLQGEYNRFKLGVASLIASSPAFPSGQRRSVTYL